MEHNNGDVACVAYEDASFLERCGQLFAANQEFTVVCKSKSAAKCRSAAHLFMMYDLERPTGWNNLKRLVQLGIAGVRVAPLMAICNKAMMLQWSVTLLSDGNRIVHFCNKR